MSFYPPGWDYGRVLIATDEEIMSLTDEQHTRLFDGLREAGLFGYVMEATERRDQEARAAAEALKLEDEKLAEREVFSPYLDSLKNVFKFSDEWSEWGFVIFRTCSYGPTHEAQWATFRGRWDQIMEEEIAEYHNHHPKLDRAIELRKFHWVEDPALEGASPYDISRRFAAMWPNLSRGYVTSVCLMVTPDSLESVLNSPRPSSAPRKERKELPFVVAVSVSAHETLVEPSAEEQAEDVDYKPRAYFRVAVESLLNGLYGTTALDIMDVPTLTYGMRHEKDIWCDSYRGGIRQYVEDP